MPLTTEQQARLREDLSCDALFIEARRALMARDAATLLAGYLAGVKAYTGGCKAFYSWTQWAEREGRALPREPGSILLVVCHDGGDVGPALQSERLTALLEDHGYWLEPGACWFTYVCGD